MKTKLLILFSLFFCWQTASAADLLEVYQQALTSDPIYQQAISQRLATKEGVPINLAAILPNISAALQPSVTRSTYSGAQTRGLVTLYPRDDTNRAYTLTLTATQTVFNYAQFVAVAGAVATSKAADATLNSALQGLMTRVATAYFNILKDEDNLSYNEATKRAYAEQLDQVKQQYDVGLKTITDVYTAQASYDSARANVIQAQTTLNNDRENLRVITGRYYSHLSPLSDNFPLVQPKPTDIDTWVHTAERQNWSIKASQYTVDSALQLVRQQFGGHLPTVNVQASANKQYSKYVTSNADFEVRNGPSTTVNREIALNINIPLYSGGGVMAATDQAIYNYQVSQQQLEQTLRGALNTTRQSYLGVIAGISQISADKQAIKSSASSLKGMEESYKVGTETLVDVLNQQQKVFQAQTQYATDRYAFINNVLQLKQAAGTLSFDDLRAINAWLYERERRVESFHAEKKVVHGKKKKRNLVGA